MGKITVEKNSELPIWGEYEVIVCGGGPAGFAASLAAARNGADTLLIERYGFLGGTATAGLMVEFGNLTDGKRRIVGGIMHEFIHRMLDYGGCYVTDPHQIEEHNCNTRFDPETFKTVAMQMCQESNVKILLHSWIANAIRSNDRIKGIIVENKAGRGAFLGRVIVDCTGDGDVAFHCGAPFEKGRTKDGLMQPLTLVFIVGDVDEVRFKEAKIDFIEIFKEARKNGDLTIPVERPGSVGRIVRKDRAEDDCRCEYFINGTNILYVDGTNPWELTRAEIAAREQVREYVMFLRKYVPGFENCYLVETAAQIGVRETRRIIGEYILTVEDVLGGKKFEDRIAIAHNTVDIHEPDSYGFDLRSLPPGVSYHVPYRVLLPKNIDNLLVAGRCISATHEALGSTRVMVVSIPIGEAAGTAAALSAKKGYPPRSLEIKELQATLKNQGIILE